MTERKKIIRLLQNHFQPSKNERGVRERFGDEVEYMIFAEDSLREKLETVRRLGEAVRKRPDKKQHVEKRKI